MWSRQPTRFRSDLPVEGAGFEPAQAVGLPLGKRRLALPKKHHIELPFPVLRRAAEVPDKWSDPLPLTIT